MTSLSDGKGTTSPSKVYGVKLRGMTGQNYSVTNGVTVRNTTKDKRKTQIMNNETNFNVELEVGNYSLTNNSGGTIDYEWIDQPKKINYPRLLTQNLLNLELDTILASDDKQKAFQDSDGLIGFVNLSSSFVTGNSEFKTGREVCDKVSNFFATLRIKVFAYLQKNPDKVLAGDKKPESQWDSAVTHYMQFLLTQAGGLTNYRVTTETYSFTQLLAEFSTGFVKLFFDAAIVPEAVIADVVNFIEGVGKSLRTSWDDRSRHYQTALLGQCHEAVPTDASGETTVYFPKIKYYYISMDSSQQEFTSPCAKTQKITFNFKYEYYVTGLKASILDTKSDDYKNFTKFLDKAQGISYKEADNNLDQILNGTVSDTPSPGFLSTGEYEIDIYGVDLLLYPRVAITPPRTIEKILNTRID
ncbi:MAG: hypothetical protein EWV48_18330 [Microcystis aeruginosa Ma_QC_C_20070823_S13]|nr:MAG: hypothetical protein EWV48_18330 [Microcystis aeruginosa Ma_QC_C_20070823_S13]TRU65446.1 MAG: hypothetical protein EWV56_00820 [Microcystis aeruginosa Ma_QC_C_20070823_S13D]